MVNYCGRDYIVRQMTGLQYYMEGLLKKMYRMNGFRPREAFLSGLVMNVCACVVTYNLICVKFKDNTDGSLSLFNLAIAFCNRKW